MRINVQDSIVPGARDILAIGNLAEFANLADSVPPGQREASRERCNSGNRWTGNKDYDESIKQTRLGDLSGVAASDKLLAELESIIPQTRSWRNRLDVVGGIPNVPAYLSGQPYNMRRRERVMSEQSPLTIFASMELSGGISIDTMRKRGATILALVRTLANNRPVELYMCNSTGMNGVGSHLLVRIDTAPLDLARAAHVLTCPSVTRGLGYATNEMLMKKKLRKQWPGHWAYGSDYTYRKHALDIFKRAVCPANEAILLPAAHLDDRLVETPVEWLKEMMVQYGGLIVEE